MGHPVLRAPAEPVAPDEIGSPALQSLIDDLMETMREYDGAGLAAPQVHVPLRVAVFGFESNPRYPEAPPIPLTVLVNPEIVPLDARTEEDWEGCLSVPGLRGRVPRFVRVKVRALDRQGRRFEFEAEGFHARVVQHECDHLDGKLYLDRMASMSSLCFLREFRRYHAHRDP